MHDVVMNFKVHRVKQIYSDLRLYDGSREQLSQFAILKPQTIEYQFMLQCLHTHGFTGSAKLYYLPPFSEPPAGLVLIDGEENIKKMVNGGDCIMHSDDNEAPYAYL